MKTLSLLLLCSYLVCGQQKGELDSSSIAFTDTLCRITFNYSKGWMAQKIKEQYQETECYFGLRSSDWDTVQVEDEFEVSDFSIYISVYAGSLDSSRDQELRGYVFEDSTWWIEGRGGTRTDGNVISSPYWTGITGNSEVGLYRKNDGGYFGSATTPVAILDNKKGRLVEIVADRALDNTTTFYNLIRSIRF